MSAVERPLVSVILPTYNRAALLPRAIRSVLTQDYRDLELIVIDDASTDDTAEVVAAIGDARVHYLRAPGNGGAARARNLGLEHARGELLAFQDSDDEWAPGKLSRQVAALQAAPPDIGMVCCAYRKRFRELEGGEKLFRPDAASEAGDCEHVLLGGFHYITPTWLMRRDCQRAAGCFDESLPNREDWELIFRVLPQWRIRVLPEVLVTKHETAGSLEENHRACIESYTAVLTRYRDRWARAPQLQAIHYFNMARAHTALGEPAQARAALWQALRHQPRAWRTWLNLLLGMDTYAALVRHKDRLLHARSAGGAHG